jgi:hypothetical protein
MHIGTRSGTAHGQVLGARSACTVKPDDGQEDDLLVPHGQTKRGLFFIQSDGQLAVLFYGGIDGKDKCTLVHGQDQCMIEC